MGQWRRGRGAEVSGRSRGTDGASLIATGGSDVIGYVAIVWESGYAGFRSRGIPLVHQIAVAGPCRRRGVATLLMDGAEQPARGRGIATLASLSACSTTMARTAAVRTARLYPRRPGRMPGSAAAAQGDAGEYG